MMRTRSLISLLVVLAMFGGCAGTSTQFDWDRNFDFANLSTWSWVERSDGGRPEDLVSQRIQAAIETTLTARGYRRVDAGGEFGVGWQTQRRDRVAASADYGYRDPNLSYWTGSYPPRGTEVSYYEEGSLVVDVIDPGANRLIWRGTATRVLQGSRTPEEIDEIVRDAVEKLFDGFPPQ